MPIETAWAMQRWEIAEATGWPLEYIDGLSLGELWEYESVKDARNKIRKANAEDRRRRR